MITLINHTSFLSGLYSGYAQNGTHQLTCVVKIGFVGHRHGQIALTSSVTPIVLADVYTENGTWMSAHETMPYKNQSEWYVIGTVPILDDAVLHRMLGIKIARHHECLSHKSVEAHCHVDVNRRTWLPNEHIRSKQFSEFQMQAAHIGNRIINTPRRILSMGPIPSSIQKQRLCKKQGHTTCSITMHDYGYAPYDQRITSTDWQGNEHIMLTHLVHNTHINTYVEWHIPKLPLIKLEYGTYKKSILFDTLVIDLDHNHCNYIGRTDIPFPLEEPQLNTSVATLTIGT